MTRAERAAIRRILAQLRVAVAVMRARIEELEARAEDPGAEPWGTP